MRRTGLLVLGSGAGGLSAAITAATLGCDVTVVEKSRWYGGTMAWSGGGIWVPANPHMIAADDKATATGYMQALLGNRFEADMVEAFLDAAPEMVRFLESNTRTCRFIAADFMPDYEPHVAGAVPGRTMSMPHFNAAELGPTFARLRAPLDQLTVLGGMQVDAFDLNPLLRRWKSIAAFRHTARLVIRQGADWLRSRRGRVLKSGNGVAARMLRASLDAGVTLIPEAPAVRLIEEDGRVVGAVVRINGAETEVRADRGVVIATGGFANNRLLRDRYMPFPDRHLSMLPEGNVGDGLTMATRLGASLGESLPNNGVWSPISVLRQPDGTSVQYPHIFLDRSRPGSIIVDRAGRRFVNEATHYQALVTRMQEVGAVPCWLIASRDFLRRYGMGLVRPYERLDRYRKAGYLVEAATPEVLAERLGIDPDGLADTFATVDRDGTLGKDGAFGRGESAYDRLYGDPDLGGNPNFGPMGKGPYCAIELVPGDLGTSVGLLTDANARVLCEDAPIPGLYAAGLDMQSMMGGAYPGAGSMLGPAMTFGYLAARHACGAGLDNAERKAA